MSEKICQHGRFEGCCDLCDPSHTPAPSDRASELVDAAINAAEEYEREWSLHQIAPAARFHIARSTTRAALLDYMAEQRVQMLGYKVSRHVWVERARHRESRIAALIAENEAMQEVLSAAKQVYAEAVHAGSPSLGSMERLSKSFDAAALPHIPKEAK